jgi:hypothetical protein
MRKQTMPAAAEFRRCVLCGRPGQIEMNHLGGQNHMAWFRMSFCIECHDRFHTMVRQAGINLEFTNDNVERIRRALSTIKIGEWMLLEQLKQEFTGPNHENGQEHR